MAPTLDTATEAVFGALSEVLPLSAGGHSALASLLVGIEPDGVARLASAAGVAVAIALVLRPQLRGMLGSLRPPARDWLGSGRAASDAVLVGVGAAGMLVVEAGVRPHVTGWGREPSLVGGAFAVTALALLSTLWAPSGDRPSPTLSGALVVGAVEGAALLPGLSAPAVGLVSLLWLGIERRRAFALCVLVLLVGRVEDVARLLRVDGGVAAGQPATAVIALLAATVCGSGSLELLRRAVAHGRLALFSLYLVPLAVATLAWGYARP